MTPLQSSLAYGSVHGQLVDVICFDILQVLYAHTHIYTHEQQAFFSPLAVCMCRLEPSSTLPPFPSQVSAGWGKL